MFILPGKTPPSSISVISAKCNILSFASFSLDLSKKSTVVKIQLKSKITKYFFPLHDDLKNWIMADCLEICWNDFIVFSFLKIYYFQRSIIQKDSFARTNEIARKNDEINFWQRILIYWNLQNIFEYSFATGNWILLNFSRQSWSLSFAWARNLVVKYLTLWTPIF